MIPVDDMPCRNRSKLLSCAASAIHRSDWVVA